MNELRSLFHSYDGCLGGKHCSCEPGSKSFMFFFNMLIWGVPALVMLAVAFLFLKAVITGEPSV